MAEEKEREVKNAAKDLVKSQRRAARLKNKSMNIFRLFWTFFDLFLFAGKPRERQRLCTKWD